MYQPIQPADIKPGDTFFVKLKPGVLHRVPPFPTHESGMMFGPCRFVKWEPESNLVRYIDTDGNAAHAETDACDFFILAPPVEVVAAPSDRATQPVLVSEDEAPVIEWTMTAGEGYVVAHGKVVFTFAVHEAFSLLERRPLLKNATLDFEKCADSEHGGFLVRVRFADGPSFIIHQQSNHPPDFETVQRMAEAWTAGRELGNEEGRKAVMDAVTDAGKIIMPFFRSFWNARP